jgi:hypothetical protein
MYLLGATKVAKYSNWTTNTTTPDWIITISNISSLSVAGDYLFLIDAVSNSEKVYLYNLSDGKYMGKLAPGDNTNGLIDIPYGLSTIKRSNGDYVVSAEEDYLGKLMLYNITGFNPNQPPVVSITKPNPNQQINSGNNISVSATASDPDGSVSKVQIFIDDSLVAQAKVYTWLKASDGMHSIYARAFDNYGDSTTSDTVHVNIIATGIKSLSSNNSIQLYPNPAGDKVYLHAGEKMTAISITDLNGRIIKLNKIAVLDGTYEINLSGIANGIYLIKVTAGDKTEILKLVVNKLYE